MVRPGVVSTKKRRRRNEEIPTHTFTPGTYQVELLDAALKKNTIVCLGSNSGNRFISVMLIREMSYQLRPDLNNGGKRSVVLLVKGGNICSQAQIMQYYTDLKVASLTSLDGMESWSSMQWNQFISNNHIFVTMPTVFEEIFKREILTVSQINLLIMEDCHLILQDHPYVEIMKKVQSSSLPASDAPRILGLTTSFTTMSKECFDPTDLRKTIRELESLLSAKAETATLVIAERYGIHPKEIVLECDDYEDTTETLSVLDDILCSALDFLNDCNLVDEDDDDRDPKDIPKFVFTECLNILYVLGPWCASCIANMFINQIEKILKHESVLIHKKFLHYCSTQLRLITGMFDKLFTPDYDVEELLQYSSPKVYKLVKHLRKFQPDYDFMIVSSPGDMDGYMDDDDSGMSDDSMDLSDDDDPDNSRKSNVIHIAVKKESNDQDSSKLLDPLGNESEKYLCGIVFVDNRYVALALNKFLEEVCSWDECLCFVKSQHITGGLKNIRGKKGGGKNYKRQEDVLRKFRLQEVNLLISTSVLEEGIDVPKCNLIVKFDPPKDYRSYSQSKGRARTRNSEYVIMVENRKLETFRKDLNMFKGIEGVLVGKWREENKEIEDADGAEDPSCDLDPYIPNKENPMTYVTADTAIALVNRYCAKLPSDAFTHLTPKCFMDRVQHEKSHDLLYSATLRLPINSPLKNVVEGNPMPSAQLAKKAVALKLCETLHKSGELDDQLMPVGKELFSIEEEDDSDLEDEEFGGEARPGTTKRKQYYFKRLALALINSHPKEEGSYLYNLNMQLTRPISDEQNTRGRKIYSPQESPRGFGLLTSKEIPLIPNFPVYTRSGEVTVSITLIYKDMCLSKEQLERLQEFHHFIFKNVLRLEKDPMEYLPGHSDLGYLVVPLHTDFPTRTVTIDWSFISEVEDSASHVKRNIHNSKRETFVFSRDDYEDAVVMPSYRNIDQPQHFYVAEIRLDLNPLSPFPSPELYKTFSEYYTTKYGLTITNFDQPLLDVDHTSARLNLLTPRYMNQRGVALPTSSAETKKARRENLQQKQILVPELCEIHVFSASLWREAVCLPTILYRVNYLLVSEEIRIKIAEATKIGLKDLPEDFCFPPLDFGFDSKEEEEEKIEEENILEDHNCQRTDSVDTSQDVDSTEENTKVCDQCEIGQSSPPSPNQSSDIINSSALNQSSRSEDSGTESQSQDGDAPTEADTKKSSSVNDNLSDTNICDKEVKKSQNLQTFHYISACSSETKQVTGCSSQKKQDKCNSQTKQDTTCDSQTNQYTTCNSQTKQDTTCNSQTKQDKCNSQIKQVQACDSQTKQDTTCSSQAKQIPACNIQSKQDTTCDSETNQDTTCNILTKQDTACSNKTKQETACDSQTKQDTKCNSQKNQDTTCNSQTKQDTSCNSQTKQDTTSNNQEIELESATSLSMEVVQDILANPLKKAIMQNETRNPLNGISVQDTTKNTLSSSAMQDNTANPQYSSKVQGNSTNPLDISIMQNLTTNPLRSTAGQDVATNQRNSCVEQSDTSNPLSCKVVPPDATNSLNSDTDQENSSPQNKQAVNENTVAQGSPWIQNNLNLRDESLLLEGTEYSNFTEVLKESEEHFDGSKTIQDSSGNDGENDIDDVFSKVGRFTDIQVKSDDTESVTSKASDCPDPELYLDEDIDLSTFIGPSPCTILQALTMSNANDFFCLERLETIGDSFLKYAITVYLYCIYPGIHEGKLSYLRSKKVSNCNLYRLGKKKGLAECMISTKFEPYENWLPPGYVINDDKRKGPVPKVMLVKNDSGQLKKIQDPEKINSYYEDNPSLVWTSTITEIKDESDDETVVPKRQSSPVAEGFNKGGCNIADELDPASDNSDLGQPDFNKELEDMDALQDMVQMEERNESALCPIPYNLQTIHSIPDKSIADCVESLIGCYLTACGKKAALKFMHWLGLKVLPKRRGQDRAPDVNPDSDAEFDSLQCPESPLLYKTPDSESLLNHLLIGYDSLEERIKYKFKDRSYLLQAFTHASYHHNIITDCYQRLEFLGDAILDYVITRHLYEDSCKYSPGVLTDLRSALVNNNIFAALAVKWDFHKYFRAISPPLFLIIEKFVTRQKEREDEIDISDEEEEEGEDEERVELEVPKALGDIFESLAGAIYLDSGMSLDVVWRVYYRIMKPQIDKYLKSIPMSPVRELLEMEPETAKFEKPKRTLEGKIRVTVNVVSKGVFTGVGRNYRIAKSAAAKKALRCIRVMQAQGLLA